MTGSKQKIIQIPDITTNNFITKTIIKSHTTRTHVYGLCVTSQSDLYIWVYGHYASYMCEKVLLDVPCDKIIKFNVIDTMDTIHFAIYYQLNEKLYTILFDVANKSCGHYNQIYNSRVMTELSIYKCVKSYSESYYLTLDGRVYLSNYIFLRTQNLLHDTRKELLMHNNINNLDEKILSQLSLSTLDTHLGTKTEFRKSSILINIKPLVFPYTDVVIESIYATIIGVVMTCKNETVSYFIKKASPTFENLPTNQYCPEIITFFSDDAIIYVGEYDPFPECNNDNGDGNSIWNCPQALSEHDAEKYYEMRDLYSCGSCNCHPLEIYCIYVVTRSGNICLWKFCGDRCPIANVLMYNYSSALDVKSQFNKEIKSARKL